MVKCKICGKEFKPKTKNPICCSRACMNLYKKTDEYRKALSEKKRSYTEEEKEKIKEKYEKTMLEKYGVKHNWSSNDDKINGRGTQKEKYNGLGMGSTIIKEKVELTKLKKYGKKDWLNPEKYKQTYANKTEEEKEKIRKAKAEGVYKKYGVYSFYQSEKYQSLYKDTTWETNRMNRIIATKMKNCTTNSSNFEITIKNLLEYIYPNLKTQYKSDKYQFFCDFYIPEINTYIEYQGTWTHGFKPFENTEEDITKLNEWKEKAKTSEYYKTAINVWTVKDPLKRQIAKENNLNWLEFFNENSFIKWYTPLLNQKLQKYNITLFDWDDIEKIINMLKEKEVIYARNLTIGNVSDKECNEFLDKYHLQNSCNGQDIKLGLYKNSELIEIMTFGKPRYNKNYEYELLRLCTKAEYKVIGGASKLFKYFIKEYKPASIISYCDNAKFTGEVYKRLGMKLEDKGKPSKHWFNIDTKRHITDNLLRQRGYSQLHNDTEHKKGESNEQLMLEAGYLEVYDCGQSTYTWKNKNL